MLNRLLAILLTLESTYKWYVLVFFLVIVTALVTKFIFKTIKWFLLLTAFVVVIVAVLRYFFGIDLAVPVREEPEKQPAATEETSD
jgi:hypothetical protein